MSNSDDLRDAARSLLAHYRGPMPDDAGAWELKLNTLMDKLERELSPGHPSVALTRQLAAPLPAAAVALVPQGRALTSREVVERGVQSVLAMTVGTEAQRRTAAERSAVAVIYSYFVNLMGGGARRLLSREQEQKIRQRLIENSWDSSELLTALDGASHDDWIMGRDRQSNGRHYREVVTIFRDRGQVERLVARVKAADRYSDLEHRKHPYLVQWLNEAGGA